jgi:hypothetical protein
VGSEADSGSGSGDRRALDSQPIRRPRNRSPIPQPIPDPATDPQLGGHIKNNGEPGWIVLGRGFQKLLDLEEGALAVLNL